MEPDFPQEIQEMQEMTEVEPEPAVAGDVEDEAEKEAQLDEDVEAEEAEARLEELGRVGAFERAPVGEVAIFFVYMNPRRAIQHVEPSDFVLDLDEPTIDSSVMRSLIRNREVYQPPHAPRRRAERYRLDAILKYNAAADFGTVRAGPCASAEPYFAEVDFLQRHRFDDCLDELHDHNALYFFMVQDGPRECKQRAPNASRSAERRRASRTVRHVRERVW